MTRVSFDVSPKLKLLENGDTNLSMEAFAAVILFLMKAVSDPSVSV